MIPFSIKQRKILQISPYFELEYQQRQSALGLYEFVLKKSLQGSSFQAILSDLLYREYRLLLDLEQHSSQHSSQQSSLRFNQALAYSSKKLLLSYIRGEAFDHVLKQSKAWTFSHKINLSIQIISQVMQLHALGFVHLDLSPGNLMYDEFQLIWLIDWMSAVDLKKNTVALLPFAKIKYTHPKEWEDLLAQRNASTFEIESRLVDWQLRQRLIKKDDFALYCILYEIWMNTPLFSMNQSQLFEYQRLSFLKDTQSLMALSLWGERHLSRPLHTNIDSKRQKILMMMYDHLIKDGEKIELFRFFEQFDSQDQ